MTDWLLPFLCGLGAAVISAWGVGGGTLLLLVMTLFLGVDQRTAQDVIERLAAKYDEEKRGIRIIPVGSRYQMTSRPEYYPYIGRMFQAAAESISMTDTQLETLAIIAYRQPVTKAEIELIRGVKCDYSVQMLVSRGLIEEVGRKEALGRPILYGTTDAFLRHFCLTSLGDLPEIDFSALAEKIAEAEAKQASEAPKADPVDKLAQNIAKEKG